MRNKNHVTLGLTWRGRCVDDAHESGRYVTTKTDSDQTQPHHNALQAGWSLGVREVIH